MSEVRTKYRFIHGLLKNGLMNLINLTYKSIPEKYLIKSVKDVDNKPEIANLLEAYELALKEIVQNNNKNFIGSNSHKILDKSKCIAITVLAQDSFYYIMLEYLLKHYCMIKFADNDELRQKVLDTFDDQWFKRLNELIDRK